MGNLRNADFKALVTRPPVTVHSFISTTGGYRHGPTVMRRSIGTHTGRYNTASGFQALQATPPAATTRPTVCALFRNTTGSHNTATGFDALFQEHHRQLQHGQRR